MPVLTAIAHPNPPSFAHAAAEAFAHGLADGRHESQVVDLHAIGFDPGLQVQDYAQSPNSPIPGGTPRDVLDQQAKGCLGIMGTALTGDPRDVALRRALASTEA